MAAKRESATTTAETEEESKRSILIVDDDPAARQQLRATLGVDEECLVQEAANGMDALNLIKEQPVDIVLLDITMPGIDGFTTLQRVKQLDDTIQVIMVTADVSAEAGFRAHTLGAFRYVTKTSLAEDEGVLISAVAKALEHRKLLRKSKGLESQIAIPPLISCSQAMEQVKYLIEKAAEVDLPVLITGESGTGKELVARSIHAKSPRRHNAFIEVNCCAIPKELLESEFFGHEKGAFTDAKERKQGKFELASEGTLFLDEIGNMSLELQGKLLRALGEKRFERVGGQGALVFTNARIISATNKDLDKEIQEGRFKSDLSFRIKTFPIHVPPLRERAPDIEPLVNHFLTLSNQKFGKQVTLTESARSVLHRYPWPGNVRELQGLIDTQVLLAKEETVEMEDLPPYILEQAGEENYRATPGSLKDKMLQYERQLIAEALRTTKGNQTKAAELLKMDRKTLNGKIKLHGLTEGASESA